MVRRAMALAAVTALLLSSSVGIVATAGAAKHRYPRTVEKSFVRTCAKTAHAAASGRLTTRQATTYCKGALACIERHLTLTQFVRTVQNMQAGKRNPNAKVLTRCEKAAIKKVKG